MKITADWSGQVTNGVIPMLEKQKGPEVHMYKPWLTSCP